MGEMCCTQYNHVSTPNTKTCAGLGFANNNMVNMPMQVPPSSNHPGGVNVLFGDGSVKFIKNSVSLRDLAGPGHAERRRGHFRGRLLIEEVSHHASASWKMIGSWRFCLAAAARSSRRRAGCGAGSSDAFTAGRRGATSAGSGAQRVARRREARASAGNEASGPGPRHAVGPGRSPDSRTRSSAKTRPPRRCDSPSASSLAKPDRVQEVQYYVLGRDPVMVFRDEDYVRNINMENGPKLTNPGNLTRRRR